MRRATIKKEISRGAEPPACLHSPGAGDPATRQGDDDRMKEDQPLDTVVQWLHASQRLTPSVSDSSPCRRRTLRRGVDLLEGAQVAHADGGMVKGRILPEISYPTRDQCRP